MVKYYSGGNLSKNFKIDNQPSFDSVIKFKLIFIS